MQQEDHILIQGIKINKKNPFIVVLDHSRINSRQKQCCNLQDNHNHNNQETCKNFSLDTFQQVSEMQIDYGMLRFSSLSSLKQNHLFSPPMQQQMDSQYSQGKRTIFPNQFVQFYYQPIHQLKQ